MRLLLYLISMLYESFDLYFDDNSDHGEFRSGTDEVTKFLITLLGINYDLIHDLI